jgi:very-short-patch-repair endonuclease
MGGQGTTADHLVARIASRQHGVITWVQLLEAGLTPRMIERRVEKGTLYRVHRGVYRVGHVAPSTQARYLAAVLAAGEGALLTGKAAGHLMRLLRGPEPPPEVVAPTKRRIQGVKARRSGSLSRSDAWSYQAIPCTTIARTLVSLADLLSEDELARACHQAHVIYRTQPGDIEAVLARHPNAPGARTLRSILHGDTRTTLSHLERRFLQLLRANNLDLPETNKQHDGRYVDCRWPAHRLTIELDSYRYHGSRHAWEQDRQREREARRRGDDFRRFTSGDIFDNPAAMLDELRPLLRAR